MTDFLQSVQVRLSGGCELLFNRQKTLTLNSVVPCGSTVADFVLLLRDQYVTQRPELFVDAQKSGLRPGILVLVNECDVEVLGGVTYILQDGDVIEFISTLHGG